MRTEGGIVHEFDYEGKVKHVSVTVITSYSIHYTKLYEEEMQAFIDSFVESFITQISDEYEVVVQEVQPDDSIYVGTVFGSDDQAGDVDFFFEQRDTIVFVLYFVTSSYNELLPTWQEIIGSYAVDPEAAKASVAPPTATPVPATQPPPTATPAPEVANPFAPQLV